MDKIASCRGAVFKYRARIENRVLNPAFPNKEDYPDIDIDTEEEEEGIPDPDPNYHRGHALDRPVRPRTPAEIFNSFKHLIKFRSGLVIFCEWMKDNFALISRNGKIFDPPDFKETFYPRIQPPIPEFNPGAARFLIHGKVGKGIEELDPMRLRLLQHLLTDCYKKEAERLSERYTEP